MYAQELRQSGLVPADCIIPVPLHRRKQKQRGYNQSEAFAEGISAYLSISLITRSLLRKTYTQSQTRKSRWERWKNVQEVFIVENSEMVKGKSIMLVDDVVTTGATLEACARALLNAGAQRVDVHTIAFARE
jgi:ComF family protein